MHVHWTTLYVVQTRNTIITLMQWNTCIIWNCNDVWNDKSPSNFENIIMNFIKLITFYGFVVQRMFCKCTKTTHLSYFNSPWLSSFSLNKAGRESMEKRQSSLFFKGKATSCPRMVQNPCKITSDLTSTALICFNTERKDDLKSDTAEGKLKEWRGF